MVKVKVDSSDVNSDSKHRHPEVENFLNLNTVLHSLVDFIRPEVYVAQDDLQTYNELKEKFLRESTTKRNKKSLEIAGVQSIRSTSGVYRFLAHHQKNNSITTNKKKPKATTPVSREELLKKLHDKMPYRQQQSTTDGANKRQRSKDKSKEPKKRAKTTTKEWKPAPSTDEKPSSASVKPTPIVPNQITFGRFEFKTDESTDIDSKKNKKGKKQPTKQKQLINQLKQVENEQNEINRLKEENPEEGKALLRSKHWQTALAKAKGEKIRDNPQLLRKSIKKQAKLRQRSAKKWKKTKSETDKRMKERQDKRQANLQKRKDDKKAKIKKRLIKKGRLVS